MSGVGRGRSGDDLRNQVDLRHLTARPVRSHAGHAARMVAGDCDERVCFAIDVVIDGVVATAARR